MANLQFNAEEYEPLDGFEPIPAGEYTASIVSSEVKPTKNGQGTYLELVWEVLEGEHKEQRVWQRVMMTHPSEKCVAMGRRKLSGVCRAVDVMQLNDSSELQNIPALIRVAVKKEAGYDPTNEIVGFPEIEKSKKEKRKF